MGGQRIFKTENVKSKTKTKTQTQIQRQTKKSQVPLNDQQQVCILCVDHQRYKYKVVDLKAGVRVCRSVVAGTNTK